MHPSSLSIVHKSLLEGAFSSKKLLSCLTWQEGDVVFDQHSFLQQSSEAADSTKEDSRAGDNAAQQLGQEQSKFDGKSIRERLLDIRPSSREDHILLLKTIFDSPDKELSMNEISHQTGIKPQNIHNRLRRLEEIGLLDRQKRSGRVNNLGRGTKEYIYCFPSNISLDEIKDLFENDGQAVGRVESTNRVYSAIKTAKPTRIESEMPKSDVPIEPVSSIASQEATTPQKNVTQAASLAEILIKKLPEFDPSWNEEMQAKWFASYERLIALGGKENE